MIRNGQKLEDAMRENGKSRTAKYYKEKMTELAKNKYEDTKNVKSLTYYISHVRIRYQKQCMNTRGGYVLWDSNMNPIITPITGE